ncbi:uracil DNA N-glycosylase Thp1 [Sporothrix bragantina]|uniref:Uracil DNA N-glycosylase Thp1 n=1 Tax=Sporothrix bragantina TaxID=671064 RepID=A0ABP0B810_9PEZI
MTEDDTLPRPSFAGRLRVADFMYTSKDNDAAASPSSPSRNLRSRSISAASPGAPSTQASPRASPRAMTKRKLEEDEGGAVALRTIPRYEISVTAGTASRSPSQSPSPTKRKSTKTKTRKAPSKYAPPSTYAHLPSLKDSLAPNLLVLFVGLNPGIETARTGHSYAHPSNLFWKLMYSSGVLPVRCTAQEDHTLPERFQLGLTNIVARPSRNGAELKPSELDDGVAILEAKARRWRPEVMCMVGKGIWDSVVRVRQRQGGRPKPAAFHYGWQDESENMGMLPADGAGDNVKDEILADEEGLVSEDGVRLDPGWKGARVFVASSTSGLAATLLPAQKEAIWRQLGEWVEGRRKEITEERQQGEEPGMNIMTERH